MTQQPLLFPLPALLRGVSRSFYVSIRLLPAGLRQPIAVGYLLARAADTIADTTTLPAAGRLEKLEALVELIEGRAPAGTAGALAASFAPLQQDEDERALILALPSCLAWLDALTPPDREEVRAVLRLITRGQALDIERFDSGGPARALRNAQELDEYTYLVAGCVGEFWTRLCARHVPGFARLPQEEMLALGRDYGMGLQLVNILRDAGADLDAGRCYFPQDELAAAGLLPEQIKSRPDLFTPVRDRWLARAQERLERGMRYAEAVHGRRVRAASALPALLGARTQRKVKMPRSEVHGILAGLAFTLAGRRALQRSFQRLQVRGWDNPGQ
jgi:farnesyl-diphosphate farnesyltransferase